MKPAPPVTRTLDMPRLVPLSSTFSRVGPRLWWLLLPLLPGFPARLRTLLSVVMQHPLADLAFLGAGDDVPQSLVHLGIVDESADRSFALVDLREDGVDVAGGRLHLREQVLGVGVVLEQATEHTLPSVDPLGGGLQRGHRGARVIEDRGGLAVRRG